MLTAPSARLQGPGVRGHADIRRRWSRAGEAGCRRPPLVVLSCGSTGTTAASDSLPAPRPLPGSTPVIGQRWSAGTGARFGRGGPPQFPPPPSERSAPSTPGSPSRLRFQGLRRFHGLHREQPGSALPQCLTTRQASLHATDRSVASPKRAFDAGLRPGPFPGQTASLLPGSLATTRTGLTPAGDDELPIRS
jgi:hypothetical protein